MRTFTFYSYKGGVGRSLALSKIAKRLSEFGKKVCILDFDLEAPGIQFKFENDYKHSSIKNGIVDYIFEFSNQKHSPLNIKNYSIELTTSNKYITPIQLIPAGNIDDDDYWKKLSMINWSEMFYEDGGLGVAFFLDLKNKIHQEFEPDFLLIDSRTGITDIAGITLKLLADEVVVLAANNEENLFGSKRIIKSLLNTSNILVETPAITFVLTRLPFPTTPNNKVQEYNLVEARKKEFQQYLNIPEFDISIIHSDSRLEINELSDISAMQSDHRLINELFLKEGNTLDGASTANDYQILFDKLMLRYLNENEIKEYNNKKIAEREYNVAMTESDTGKRIQHITKAIELDSTKYIYYKDRGATYLKIKELEKALIDFMEAYKLSWDDTNINNAIGIIYFQKADYHKAIEFFDKCISINNSDEINYLNKGLSLDRLGELEKAAELYNKILTEINPNNDQALNCRANYYRITGKLESAFADIFKAVQINSNIPKYFATLADIYAMQHEFEAFYLNLTIALTRGLNVEALNSAKEVYESFRNEERFINLMNKYQIDMDELFA